jgi:hypothetical protein
VVEAVHARENGELAPVRQGATASSGLESLTQIGRADGDQIAPQCGFHVLAISPEQH